MIKSSHASDSTGHRLGMHDQRISLPAFTSLTSNATSTLRTGPATFLLSRSAVRSRYTSTQESAFALREDFRQSLSMVKPACLHVADQQRDIDGEDRACDVLAVPQRGSIATHLNTGVRVRAAG